MREALRRAALIGAFLARRSASVFTLRMEDLMFGNEFHLLNFLVLHYSTTNASIMQEKITNMPACSCKKYFTDLELTPNAKI